MRGRGKGQGVENSPRRRFFFRGGVGQGGREGGRAIGSHMYFCINFGRTIGLRLEGKTCKYEDLL